MDATSRKRVQQTARRRAWKVMKDNDSRLHEIESTMDQGSESDLNDLNSDIDESLPSNKENEQSDTCSWKFDEIEENFHFSSDSEEDEDEDFCKNLANWAVECSITLLALTKLLGILRRRKLDVPAQATTLLQTRRNVELMKKSGKIH